MLFIASVYKSGKQMRCMLTPQTYSIDLASVGSDPQAASTAPHRGNQGPQVGVRVVAFSRREAVISIETPTYVHLQDRFWLDLIWIGVK